MATQDHTVDGTEITPAPRTLPACQREAVADALRHATNRYRAGYSPYLEQIDAQRALLSVELAILQVRSDRLTAHVALYQALGGAPESEA